MEAIAGRMRTDDAYGLESSVPMVQAEQSDEMKALITQMQTLDCIACSILYTMLVSASHQNGFASLVVACCRMNELFWGLHQRAAQAVGRTKLK